MPRRGIDLTEEQWRVVKSHAATRGQTISEFFADVLADLLPNGQVRPATRSVPAVRPPGDRPPDPIITPVTTPDATNYNSRPFTPAPKPSRKK